MHGGDWNEESEAFAQIKLLCSGCYEARKRAIESDDADDTGIALKYLCGSCDEIHEGLPAWSARYPAPYLDVPEDERAERSQLAQDTCVVDDEHYFVLGNIEVPIIGHTARMSFGVWVSLSKDNFDRAVALMDAPHRVQEEPYFGWLCNRLPESLYPDTMLLKTHVFQRAVGRRPLIALEPTDHPLSVAQQTGISVEEARDVAERLLATQGGRLA